MESENNQPQFPVLTSVLQKEEDQSEHHLPAHALRGFIKMAVVFVNV